MTPAPTPAPGRIIALLALVIVIWGLNWPVMKVGLGYMPPFWFAATRTLLAAASLFVVVAAVGKLRLPVRADLPILASLGLFTMPVFLALVTVALLHVPAGRSAVLSYTTPLWVTPAAIVLLGERLTPGKSLGLAVGLLGVAALLNPLGVDWADPDTALGNALLIAASVVWTVQIIHIRAHRWRHSALQLAPWQMAIAGLILAAVGLVFEPVSSIDWSGELGLILAFNGPIASGFAVWAMITINRALPAITTSIGFLGVPALGLVTSAVFLGERVTWGLGGGFALIIAGIALVALADRRETAARAPAGPGS